MRYGDLFNQLREETPIQRGESTVAYHKRLYALVDEVLTPRALSPHQHERPKVLQKVKDRYR